MNNSTRSNQKPFTKVLVFERKQFFVILTVGLMFCDAVAASADSYSDACKSYADNNFEAVRDQFEAATKAYPKSWEANYQLGNCYIRLKKSSKAAECYQKALDCNPPATYKDHITKAMAAVARVGASSGGTKTAELPPSGSNLNNGDASVGLVDPIQQKIDERRKQILKEAQKDAARVRNERMLQRKELEASGNQWFVSRSTGTVYTNIPRDVAAELDAETERLVNQIMTVGRQKAGAVNSP